MLIQDLSLIKKWSTETQTGDIGELTYIAEDSKALPFVTSTVDNCLGKDCPDFSDKKQMVINHHYIGIHGLLTGN